MHPSLERLSVRLLRNGKVAAGLAMLHFADMRATRRFWSFDE